MSTTTAMCAYCHVPLERLTAPHCPECDSVHHADCWEENGGCSVFGCAAGPEGIAAPAVEPTRQLAVEPTRQLAVEPTQQLAMVDSPVFPTSLPVGRAGGVVIPPLPPTVTAPTRSRSGGRRRATTVVGAIAVLLAVAFGSAAATQANAFEAFTGHLVDERALDSAVSDATEEAYDEGYSDGSSDGWDEGYSEGSSDGWDAGYDSGYSDGWDEGYDDGSYYSW